MTVNYNLISTGSRGNAIVYEDVILVDIGLPYIKLYKHIEKVKYILMTHRHRDHIYPTTIKRIQLVYPDVTFICGEWLRELLIEHGAKNIKVLEYGKWYNFKEFKVAMIKAYHDTENCGYRIEINGKRIFHLTDTFTVEGITANDYDLIAIECHHDELDMEKWIAEKEEKGQFCYEIGARNSHLSFQKAQEFINRNRGEHTEILKLHISSKYEKEKK